MNDHDRDIRDYDYNYDNDYEYEFEDGYDPASEPEPLPEDQAATQLLPDEPAASQLPPDDQAATQPQPDDQAATPTIRTEEGVLFLLKQKIITAPNGFKTRRTSFTLTKNSSIWYSGAYGNDFDESYAPAGSHIRFKYIVRPSTHGVWRNLIDRPTVIRRGEPPCADVTEYPGLDAGVGFVQHGTGSRTDSVTLAQHIVGNVNRAQRQFRNLAERGPLPRSTVARIAEAVSALGQDVRAELSRSL